MKNQTKRWIKTLLAAFIVFQMLCAPVHAVPVTSTDAKDVQLYQKVQDGEYGEYQYSFGVLSDVHFGSSDYAESSFRNALQFFKEQGITVVNISGDISENATTEEFSQYQSVVNEFPELTVNVVTGNHDATTSSLNVTNWTTYTGREPYYVVEKGNDVFVFLSQYKWTGDSPFNSDSLTWLQEQFEKYKDKRVFLFEHIPLYETVGNLVYNGASLYPEGNFIKVGNTQDTIFRNLLKKYKNVIHFNGHTHWRYYLEKFNPDLNLYNGDGEYGYMVHVSSCGSPIDSDGTNRLSSDSNRYKFSEGAYVDVYEHAIIVNDMRFRTDGEFVNAALKDHRYVITDENKVKELAITPETLKCGLEDSNTFDVKVYSQGNVDRSVSWSVDAPEDEVTIDENGCVTVTEKAREKDYVVTARSNEDETVTATAILRVTDDVEPNGSKNHPYLIGTPEDFIALTDQMNAGSSNEGVYYKQTKDIDLSQETAYVGVSAYNSSSGAGYFKGHYDGAGHTVKVNISTANADASLFGNITGSVKNLGVTGAITSTHAGGSGYPSSFARAVRAGGSISNCWSDATITALQPGGIVRTNYGNMKNCYFFGSLQGSTDVVATAMGTLGTNRNNYYYLTENLDSLNSGEKGSRMSEKSDNKNLANSLNMGRTDRTEVMWTVDEDNTMIFAGYQGDINRDGNITMDDTVQILHISTKNEELKETWQCLADYNGDGKISAVDALYMLME
ncbi:MAG: metallophosphoesterase [Lachnospiraceae bacterium]